METEFDNTRYTPDLKYTENGDGILETYSPDVDEVVRLANSPDCTRVWTIMDCELKDSMLIVAGYHIVNRFQYFISNEPWESEDECYNWYKPHEEEICNG